MESNRFTGFATLDPDLLHLVLSTAEPNDTWSQHQGVQAAVRAGATCKHWQAVASTNRLWREFCVRRWRDCMDLRRQPSNFHRFYQLRRHFLVSNSTHIFHHHYCIHPRGPTNPLEWKKMLSVKEKYEADMEVSMHYEHADFGYTGEAMIVEPWEFNGFGERPDVYPGEHCEVVDHDEIDEEEVVFVCFRTTGDYQYNFSLGSVALFVREI